MIRNRSRGSSPRRVLAPALAIALAVTAFGTPVALADTGPDPASEAAFNAATAKMTAEQPPATETDKAVAEAKATGKNVPIDSLTTEYTETSATPEGHLALTAHPDQQRTKRSGAWQPLDATLAANPDGTFSPKSSAGQLVLSKGGNGTLATMTSADGKKLSITAPFPLASPTVSGDSVTYPAVAPDIDLKVTATKAGGLTTILVVKTQAATADPLLKNLHFGTITDGVTLTGDQAGNLVATAEDGKPRFLAPTPLMWDSTSRSSSAGPSARRALTAQGTTTAPTAEPAKASTTSTSAGPGTAALSATMPARADSNGIDLTPDQNLLTNGTAPYFIDPAWKPAPTTSANAWTWVQSGEPGTSNYNRTGDSDSDYPGVGVCGDYGINGGSCKPSSAYRSFFQFDTHALNGTVIHSATITFQEYVSADWNCTNTYGVDLYLTGGINAQTTWGYQPGQLGNSLGTKAIGGSGRDGCYGNVPFDYDVTGTFQNYAPTYPNLTFGLYGSETNQYAFKRVTPQPTLSVWYDRVPNVPTNQATYPAPKTISPSQSNQDCNGTLGNAAWLGAGSEQAGAVTLTTTVSSPVQATLYSWTHIWDYNDPRGVTDVDSGLSAETASGGTASFTVKSSAIHDGHLYGWAARATDLLGSPWSASTPTCFFKVDMTKPKFDFGAITDPTKQFPPSGSGITPQLYAGQQGSIPITTSDQSNPPGAYASGAICVSWGPDPQLSKQYTQTSCGTTAPTQIPVTPGHWGTNIVYTRVQDNAGNVSDIQQYSFYAPWNPNGPAPVFGDITGDSAPDIVAPDKSGNLRAFTVPGSSSGAASPATSVAADTTHTPQMIDKTVTSDSWANYQTTHRGSLSTGTNVDGLFAHKKGDPKLRFYMNPSDLGGTGRFDAAGSVPKPACHKTPAHDCTGYNATDWSTVQQIAAVGDPLSTSLKASNEYYNRTGLFTVEDSPDGDGALWFYPSIADGAFAAAINISPTGWKGWDLISPGDWKKEGHPGLWARRRDNGDVHGYTFTIEPITTTNPATGNPSDPFSTFTGLATNKQIASGVVASQWPLVGSDGDLIGNGAPTLWGITPTGDIQIWTARQSTNDPTAFSWTGPLTVGSTAIAPNQWRLNGASSNNGIATDGSGANPATIYNTVGWTTDHKQNAQSAAAVTGTGFLRTQSPAVDTSHSYTVSAWVQLTGNAGSDQTFIAEGGNNHQAFYLGYSATQQAWQYQVPTDDNATGTGWITVNSAKGSAVQGTWTHLTATYNADTQAMTLYVNGTYVGATPDKSPWTAPYGLSIGAAASAGNTPYGNATGAVSDVHTYPYALTPNQVTALYKS
ncbi:LamG domain-containing protein [Kitasatospora sp. MMS16-BH015]|uniref:LamG domain-containing protein n=1 Tax=Kitasatospora sp. MMS16-BH015 TaxID=2018025 RepID=UPI00131A54C2|nr:LamG domain-containing protein [Kitasatospora sp. MMS16-BH015]